MADFDDGVIGRSPEPADPAGPGPGPEAAETIVRATDARGLVTITARANRIDTVTIEPSGFEQPHLLGEAIAEATNAVWAQFDRHWERIEQAPDLVTLYHQVHEQNAASQKRFDDAVATIGDVQQRLDSQIAGLRAIGQQNSGR